MKAGKAGINYIQKASTRWRTHLQHVRMMSSQLLVKLPLMATLPTIVMTSCGRAEDVSAIALKLSECN